MTSNEDAAADSSGGATIPTRAQVLAQRAYELIESSGQTGLASVLSDRFVHESRRGHHFDLDGPHLLDTVKTMRSLGMHISGITVAVAGDLCVLSRRRYARVDAEVELLAISVWDDDDRLERLIEFDPDDLESALAALADVSDEPVEILPG
jgi:hypothetical protein